MKLSNNPIIGQYITINYWGHDEISFKSENYIGIIKMLIYYYKYLLSQLFLLSQSTKLNRVYYKRKFFHLIHRVDDNMKLMF